MRWRIDENPACEVTQHGVSLPYQAGLYDEQHGGNIAYGYHIEIANLVDRLNWAEEESLADLKIAHDMMIGEICPDG